jgi:hypothetical protein
MTPNAQTDDNAADADAARVHLELEDLSPLLLLLAGNPLLAPN